MECSKEIGWGSLSPISMWMVHVVIFSHNFLVPFITNPLSDEKTELEQWGGSEVMEGINGEKPPYTSGGNINNRMVSGDSSRPCLGATFGLMLSISACPALVCFLHSVQIASWWMPTYYYL